MILGPDTPPYVLLGAPIGFFLGIILPVFGLLKMGLSRKNPDGENYKSGMSFLAAGLAAFAMALAIIVTAPN